MTERADVVVLGMGPDGEDVAGRLAQAGLNVVGVEERLVGERGVLVGATSAGPAGGEVLSMLTLAVHAETPLDQLRRMIYAYPTFHRAVEDALRDLAGRS